jgi:hypothetical protein
MKKGQTVNVQGHATKECEIANFYGQTADAYAYV